MFISLIHFIELMFLQQWDINWIALKKKLVVVVVVS